MPNPSASSKNVLTCFQNILNLVKYFWPWSKVRYVLVYLEYLNMVKYIWPHSKYFESCQSRWIRYQSTVKIELHRQENTLILNYLRLTNVTNKKTIDRFTNLNHFCCWVRKSEELWSLMLKHFSSYENLIKSFCNQIGLGYKDILQKSGEIKEIKKKITDQPGHWSFKA